MWVPEVLGGTQVPQLGCLRPPHPSVALLLPCDSSASQFPQVRHVGDAPWWYGDHARDPAILHPGFLKRI